MATHAAGESDPSRWRLAITCRAGIVVFHRVVSATPGVAERLANESQIASYSNHSQYLFDCRQAQKYFKSAASIPQLWLFRSLTT